MPDNKFVEKTPEQWILDIEIDMRVTPEPNSFANPQQQTQSNCLSKFQESSVPDEPSQKHEEYYHILFRATRSLTVGCFFLSVFSFVGWGLIKLAVLAVFIKYAPFILAAAVVLASFTLTLFLINRLLKSYGDSCHYGQKEIQKEVEEKFSCKLSTSVFDSMSKSGNPDPFNDKKLEHEENSSCFSGLWKIVCR